MLYEYSRIFYLNFFHRKIWYISLTKTIWTSFLITINQVKQRIDDPFTCYMCLIIFNPKLSYCMIRERQKRAEGHDLGLIRGQWCPRGPYWPLALNEGSFPWPQASLSPCCELWRGQNVTYKMRAYVSKRFSFGFLFYVFVIIFRFDIKRNEDFCFFLIEFRIDLVSFCCF